MTILGDMNSAVVTARGGVVGAAVIVVGRVVTGFGEVLVVAAAAKAASCFCCW